MENFICFTDFKFNCGTFKVIFIVNIDLIRESGKYTLNKFEFENGEILENVEVEYILKGTPKYDRNGKINNAVIMCHKFDGNANAIEELYPLFSKDGPLNLNEIFIISITSLGSPDSCSPSSTGLRYEFPEYNFKDKVNFKKQFIKEKFHIEKILGIIGSGMGGYELFTWACEYPDDMDFIVVINSSFKTSGYRYAVSKGIKSIIEVNEDNYLDGHDNSLSEKMFAINKVMYSNYFSKKVFQKMSNDEIDVLMDDFADENIHRDIYDFKLQTDAILKYDVEDKLSNIKAKTLVVTPSDDLYFSYELDIKPMENLIENCQIEFFDLSKDYYDGIIDYNNLINILNPFLEEFREF